MGASDLVLSDEEVEAMCEGLVQHAAKVRYLRKLGLRVDRKPSGRPLVWRPTSGPAPETINPHTGPNIVGLEQWSKSRSHGPQKKGR